MNKLHINEKLTALLQGIDMPQEVTEAILAYKETGKETLPGMKELTEHILLALKNRKDGPWEEIPEDIFVATMSAFSRFVKEYHFSYGTYGYDRAFWTTRQANATLFRLGELEYELLPEDKEHIAIHIPSDAKMTTDRLNESVAMAKTFFTKYYPDHGREGFCLESWLLSPELKKLLPETSNILHFQAAFDITQVFPDAKDHLEWVFKIPGAKVEKAVLADLPEDTSLQRSMKKHLLAGGKVGVACGILKRTFQ